MAAFALSSSSALSQNFDLNSNPRPDLIINDGYLYLIKDKTETLSNHSLTIDGHSYDWNTNGFKKLRLISINTDEPKATDPNGDGIHTGDGGGDGSRYPIENAKISGNKSQLSNIDSLSEFNQVYVTAANDSEVSLNEVIVTDSQIDYFRPIYIDEISSYSGPIDKDDPNKNPNKSAVGSKNLIIKENSITSNNLSTKNLWTAINVSGAEGTISSNELSITGGTHNTITGISAAAGFAKGGAYLISGNQMTVIDSSFKSLQFIKESVPNKPGRIDQNTLSLSGVNTLLYDRSKSPELGAVYSSSDNVGSELAVTGTLKIETKKQRVPIYAGQSQYGVVSNAKSIFSNTKLDNSTAQAINLYGGLAEKDSTNNYLSWENGSSSNGFDSKSNASTVIGGRSYSGAANMNSVLISDSSWHVDKFTMAYASDYDRVTVSSGYFLQSAIIGGVGQTSAKNNSVTLHNSSVKARNIIGSYTDNGQLSSSITIDNSIIEGSVQLFYASKEATGKDSTLIVRGEKTDLSKARLLTTSSKTVETSNNTLQIDGWSGDILGLGTVLSDGQLRAFENIKFTNTQWADGKTILNSNAHLEQFDVDYFVGTYTVVDPLSIGEGSLQFVSAPTMQENESMTLIHADEGITYTDTSLINTDRTIKGNAGTATEFEGTLNYGENDITYSVQKIERAPQTTLLGDSRIAAAAFVNQSTDMLSQVLDSFLYDQKYGLATFASAEGNKSQYELNSSLKINGWNFMAGLRYKDRLNYGDWTSAVYFENGDGNYRTWNEYMGNQFRTNGELTYNGVGIASRIMVDSGLYAEGSIQAGRIKIDMDNALMDTAGKNWDFNSHSNYYGAHLGIGWLAPISSTLSVDAFGKYFYSHITSDSFQVNVENYDFSDIDSQRLQMELKLNYAKDNVRLYIGLGGEYEFDGESSMKAASTPKFVSDLDGFTGIAEAGVMLTPRENSPWLFQANVKGWEGQRDAVAGSLTVQYQFQSDDVLVREG